MLCVCLLCQQLQKRGCVDAWFAHQVTDSGVGDLVQGLRELHTLELLHCVQITDNGVKALSRLRNLHTLRLSECDERVTIEGIKVRDALLRRQDPCTGCIVFVCTCTKLYSLVLGIVFTQPSSHAAV